jgi:hypothetical protein
MKMKLPEMYGITRIDVDGNERAVHAYRVSIQKRNKKYVKYFTDIRSGGKKKALSDAKAYRDKIVKATKPFTRAEISNAVKTKNKSGMVGVTLVVKINDRGKKPLKYYYWKAWWSPEVGKPKTAAFSINKYGYEGALELAKKTRLKGLKEMKELDLSFLKLSRLRTKTRIHKR